MTKKLVNKKQKTKKDKETPLFLEKLGGFLKHLRSLRKMEIFFGIMSKILEAEYQKTIEFVKRRGILSKNTEKGKIGFSFKDFHDSSTYETLYEEMERTKHGLRVIPTSVFVSTISQFDFLLSDFMRYVLIKYPSIISKERNLSYKELQDFRNLNEAVDYLIEKEIDSVFFGNHEDQIKWFEDKLKVEIKKHIKDILPTFFELIERRNLFVHADGVVTGRYIRNCKRFGVALDESIKEGSRLKVDSTYFKKTYDCLYEISVKITYLLLRKMTPEYNKEAESQYNDGLVELIKEKKYGLAFSLADFAIQTFKNIDDETLRLFTINQALAKRLEGKQDIAIKIINKKDWTSVQDEFKLAINIIKGNTKASLGLMEKIGKNSDLIRKRNYEEDPLYIPLRSNPRFLEIFKKIFGEEYITVEKSVSSEMKKALVVSTKSKKKKKTLKK